MCCFAALALLKGALLRCGSFWCCVGRVCCSVLLLYLFVLLLCVCFVLSTHVVDVLRFFVYFPMFSLLCMCCSFVFVGVSLLCVSFICFFVCFIFDFACSRFFVFFRLVLLLYLCVVIYMCLVVLCVFRFRCCCVFACVVPLLRFLWICLL